MLPSETQKIIDQHGIKYVLAQFVDIHGAAKTKSVPVCGLEAVAEAGAGFAGFAICGMGMEPHGPDFMAKGAKPQTLNSKPCSIPPKSERPPPRRPRRSGGPCSPFRWWRCPPRPLRDTPAR